MSSRDDHKLVHARFARTLPVVAAEGLGVAVLGLLMAACSGSTRPDLNWLYQPPPDLARLYAGREEAQFQNPVILIHGVFGARLRRKDSGEEVWPGGAFRLLFHDYEEIALPIDPHTLLPAESELEAFGITDQVAGRDYYGHIVRTLEDAGGRWSLQAGAARPSCQPRGPSLLSVCL